MTKELEQRIVELNNKIKELDDYNSKLIRDNNQLINEYKDLEYELFLEKTKDSDHKFYWFTTKKTPLVSDVSYTNNENDFYGFKQVPKYEFIEQHDLRFITNCSLDVLFEQFG